MAKAKKRDMETG